MKRNAKAGIALGFLSFLYNEKAMLVVVAGSNLIAISAISIGSIEVQVML
ncbi:MAG TPA: hypothetical protein VIP70_02920 [Nitrososphaeraceae archaeon]